MAAALAVSLPLLLLAGCAGEPSSTQKDLDRLNAEIVKIRAENAALNERIDNLEIRTGSLKGYAEPDPDRPELRVVELGPEAADPGYADPDADTARPVLKSTGRGEVVEEERAGGGGDKGKRDAERAIEAAQSKNCDDATAFLSKYGDHSMAPTVGYWRGECLLAKGEHRKALDQFEAVTTGGGKTDKVPEALYGMVRAAEKLGNKAAADDAKKKLLDQFPDSAAAKKLKKK